MSQDTDAVLHEYLLLKEEVKDLTSEIERQQHQIADLLRPRHWTEDGPRGAQATAIHHGLDRVLEHAVKVRDLVRPNRPAFHDTLGSDDDRSTRDDDQPASNPADVTARSPEVFDGAYLRLAQATDLLGAANRSEGRALDAFVAAVGVSDRPASALAWLGFVAIHGRYPTSPEFGVLHRALRSGGPTAFGSELESQHVATIADGEVSSRPLAIREGAILVDVDHTARHDLHTGIQRVVRETVSRWLDDDRVVLVWWDSSRGHLRELGNAESYRFRNWAAFLPDEADSEPIVHDFVDTPNGVVVPWDSVFVLPELSADHRRASCYVPLVRSGIVTDFGVIGYDLVPLTSAETVHHGMVAVFPSHISVLKYAHRISAISESAAQEFIGLWHGLSAQGLPVPDVAAHSLPPTIVAVGDAEVDELRREHGIEDPVVLVVGSREPRKNQIAVLEAGDRLWRAGHRFHLVMVGGSGWNAGDVDNEVERLRSIGVPITIRTRAAEDELFAWYRMARFSMFPSLHEGFGLPIVESMASGTPVITSGHGAMAEVAGPGGALLVDPRNADEVADAMERMLTDDDLVARLRTQAQERTWPTWDEYAQKVWRFLLGEKAAP